MKGGEKKMFIRLMFTCFLPLIMAFTAVIINEPIPFIFLIMGMMACHWIVALPILLVNKEEVDGCWWVGMRF